MAEKSTAISTPSKDAMRYSGSPSPLDKTKPPIYRQIIQYSYFLINTHPHLSKFAISKLIAKDVIDIWKAVKPRLPLLNIISIVNKVNILCFQKAKQINRKSLPSIQKKLLNEKLDTLFDISSCSCKLPVLNCDDPNVNCNIENCQTKHIICTCPLKQQVPVEDREYLKGQRVKIGPKGTFQLGPKDKSAKKCKRKKERLRQQNNFDSSPIASTSYAEDVSSHSFSSSPSEEAEGLNRKRHQYSIEYKLNAIAKWRELNENTSQAARHPDVNVDRQTLKGWILNEESYRAMSNKKVAKRLRRKSNISTIKYGDLQKNLVQFIHNSDQLAINRRKMTVKVEPSDRGPSDQGPSDQGYPGTLGTTRRTRNTSATSTVSSMNSLSQPDSLSQPSAAKFQKKSGRRPKKRGQKSVIHSVQPSLPTPVPVAKRKPVQRPRPEEKRIFLVVDHQRHLMSNLAALWERGKLCDAVIGNGLETVMVHKLVLSAMCPKLLSVFDMDILSNKILQVNFPAEVGTDALNAFAEYMYKGILDLDCDILEQLKIIAKRLDMIEFEQLCDSHLPNHMHQPDSAESFSNVPLIQTIMPITQMTSFEPAASTSMQSSPSIPTQVVNIKQEITEDGLAQAEQATTAVYNQELVGSSLAPTKFENISVSVIHPTIKTEPVGPEDEKYGRLDSSISNQPFTLTALSSSSPSVAPASSTSTAPVPASSTEFSIPFIEKKDVKSTKLKATHSYDVPAVSDLSNGGVYPVGLFSARGDNLPLLTTHTSEDIKIHPFIPSEKT